MGGFASALQSVGQTGENVAQGKNIFAQQRQQQAMDQLNMFAAKLRLQQLQQALQPQNDLAKKVAAVESVLGRPMTDQEKQIYLGIEPTKAATPKPTYSNFRVGKEGELRGYNTEKNIEEVIPGSSSGQFQVPGSQPSSTEAGQYTDLSGKKGYGYRDPKSKLIYDAASGQLVQVSSFVPASEQPTTSESVSFQTVAGPDGSQQLVAIPTTRTSGKGGQGGPIHISKPIPMGPKALPPALAEKLNSLVSVLQGDDKNPGALTVFKRLRDNIDVLDNPMSAAKIGLAASGGGLANLISRGTPMTAKEQQFASDWIAASEEVNLLRGPLSAAGFRGPQAWEKLQEQKGSLLKSPAITKGLLDQSIGILQGQLNQAQKTLGTGAGKGPLTLEEATDYVNRAGGDKNKARQMARDDGRTF